LDGTCSCHNARENTPSILVGQENLGSFSWEAAPETHHQLYLRAIKQAAPDGALFISCAGTINGPPLTRLPNLSYETIEYPGVQTGRATNYAKLDELAFVLLAPSGAAYL
jgi:hypothetical protein